MWKKGFELAVLMFILSAALYGANGAAGASQPPKHWHQIDADWLNKFKKPTEFLEMGLDVRLREVYARNIFSLNDSYGDNATVKPGNWNNYHWQRYRTRWSTKWLLDDNLTFNTRLTWEFWGHCAPDRSFYVSYSDTFFAEKNYDFDEALFDIFNVQWKNAFDAPLTLTVGRQEIILGTGWLVLDGTPADGSRTIYFDAVRGTYQISDATKLDLIYIQQYDDETRFITPFNHGSVADRRHVTQKQDEIGAIAYLTHKLTDMTSFDAYYMYKNDEASDWAKFWLRKTGGVMYRPGPDQETHVLGGRLFGNLDKNWSYSAEGAYQFGSYKDYGSTNVMDHEAFGANTKLQYSFLNDWSNEVHVGYEFLSGDDPGTSNKYEKFNTMWGDWPQYQRGGDLQSYMWTAEGALGEVANLHRFGIGQSFKPHKDWTIATDWNLLWADENTFAGQTRGPGGMLTFSDSGKFRGHMLTFLATYRCCKNFATYFLVDYFLPGGYYAHPSTDPGLFARISMEWTF